MSQQSYAVSSTSPISVFPAGIQPALTIVNQGSATVYVQDVATGASGYPITAGNGVQWAAGSPLYAYVDAGNATTLLVMTSGTIAPPNQMTISGPVTADISGPVTISSITSPVATAVTTAIVYNPLASPPVGIAIPLSGIGSYSSLIISWTAAPTYVFGGGSAVLNWYDSTGTYIIATERVLCDSGTNFNVPNVWTTSVKGASATLTLNSTGQPYVSARVFGTTAKVPDSYTMPGGATEGLLIGASASLNLGSVASNVAYTWKPAVLAGSATLTIYANAATNTGGGVYVQYYDELGNYFYSGNIFSATATALYVPRFIIPKRTCALKIINFTSSAVTFLATIAMNGN